MCRLWGGSITASIDSETVDDDDEITTTTMIDSNERFHYKQRYIWPVCSALIITNISFNHHQIEFSLPLFEQNETEI